MFYFSCKILSAPSEKIRLLWIFCHLFPLYGISIPFYGWNTSIDGSFWFFGFFFYESFFNGVICFPLGKHQFWWRVSKKNKQKKHGIGKLAPCPRLQETLQWNIKCNKSGFQLSKSQSIFPLLQCLKKSHFNILQYKTLCKTQKNIDEFHLYCWDHVFKVNG